MNRIHKFQTTFTTTLGVILISLSYMLKDIVSHRLDIDEQFAIVALGFASLLLSLVSTSFLTDLCLRSRMIRRMMYGSKCIEGFWLFESNPLETSETNDEARDLFSSPGLGEIFYDVESKSFAVIFYRFHPHLRTKESFTYSNAIVFDDSQLKYVNHFDFGTSEGSAFGRFFSSPGARLPDLYQGMMLLTDRAFGLRQQGRRIANKVVRKTKKQYKADWKKHLIQNSGSYLNQAA